MKSLYLAWNVPKHSSETPAWKPLLYVAIAYRNKKACERKKISIKRNSWNTSGICNSRTGRGFMNNKGSWGKDMEAENISDFLESCARQGRMEDALWKIERLRDRGKTITLARAGEILKHRSSNLGFRIHNGSRRMPNPRQWAMAEEERRIRRKR
jgi:hypothetical protein